MIQLLDVSQSSYFTAFRDLFNETLNALEEAQDIADHLKPLTNHFELLESTEFDEIKSAFDPMFHTICLTWSHSKHYCRPARIIVLIQELNNLIIKRAIEFLEPLDLFKGEPEESLEKIQVCFGIINGYQKSYLAHKSKIKEYFKNGMPVREWEFTPKLVFARFDKFMEKLDNIRVTKQFLSFYLFYNLFIFGCLF